MKHLSLREILNGPSHPQLSPLTHSTLVSQSRRCRCSLRPCYKMPSTSAPHSYPPSLNRSMALSSSFTVKLRSAPSHPLCLAQIWAPSAKAQKVGPPPPSVEDNLDSLI